MVTEALARIHVDDLAHADIGIQPIGMFMREGQADKRAPGMADHEDLLLAIGLAQILHDIGGVFVHARDGEGGRNRLRIIGVVGLARTALVPLHDREVVLPAVLERPACRHLGRCRSAVKEEQDRIARVAPANGDPLFGAADGNLHLLVDAVRADDLLQIADDVNRSLAREFGLVRRWRGGKRRAGT